MFLAVDSTPLLLHQPLTFSNFFFFIFLCSQSEPEEVPEFLNEQAKGESAFVYKDEIGKRVVHVYTIQNNGPWHVSNVDVRIEWPFQVANDKEQGKWLLYMDERPTIEGNALE